MKARYVSHSGTESSRVMTLNKIYTVIGIEANWYRIIGDDDYPYLFDDERIELIEESIPDFWVTEYIDGMRYSGPFSWSRAGFFEDFHDGDEQVVEQFWEDCQRFYEISRKV